MTSTTAEGKVEPKKDIVAILAAHRVPYIATISLAHLDDAARKMSHALDGRGFRFVHLLAPCPTGWKSEPSDTIELVRQAVRSGIYPVLEVLDGETWVINVEPELSSPALERYLALQGRFRLARGDVTELRADVARQWKRLRKLAAPSDR